MASVLASLTRLSRRQIVALLVFYALTFVAGMHIGSYIGSRVTAHKASNVVISTSARNLDDAIAEDLEMTPKQWRHYADNVIANVDAALAAGLRPGGLTITDDGEVTTIDGHAVNAPAVTTPVASAGPPPTVRDPDLDDAMVDAACSTGLPVTLVTRTITAAWITADHCIDSTDNVIDIFGGEAGVDAHRDYVVTDGPTIPDRPHADHDNRHFTRTLPPIVGMKTCAATYHGWRCGTITDVDDDGEVASTLYSSPGASGSIAGLGPAAVHMVAWTRLNSSITDDDGNPLTIGAGGYSIEHIIDHADDHGTDVRIGWH